MNSLTALSPLDGRYSDQVQELASYFSEFALMRYRVMVEIEYLIALGEEPGVTEVPRLAASDQDYFRSWHKNFSLEDAERIKTIEKNTNHDVKAIEYFLKEKIEQAGLTQYKEFVHFALTSEDTNNLAYSLMWREALRKVYFPVITNVYYSLRSLAEINANQPMLAMTHGQSATPTTVGKEFAVFASRLKRQIDQLKAHQLLGKFSGATGTWSAHMVAYPDVDWVTFSKKFISSLGLEPNLITTQIESHDALAESYHILQRINTILIDLCRDLWMYVSRGIFGQKKKESEIGSSTMPHKINPIHFENAEGNLGIANAYFAHLAAKLPISRMQRDLSDSTVLRNQGVPLAHSLLACQNILTGLSRLTINEQKLKEELNAHPEVLAEAIQTILRKCGQEGAYEQLKELTRGHLITLNSLREFVQTLDIPAVEKEKLLSLTPQTYIGLAARVVDSAHERNAG